MSEAPSTSNGNNQRGSSKPSRGRSSGQRGRSGNNNSSNNNNNRRPSKSASSKDKDKASAAPAAAAATSEVQQTKDPSEQLAPVHVPDFEAQDETCFICAEPVHILALPPCSHKTCHVCFVRLKALYKKTTCTFCNQDFGNQPVVFTRDATKEFSDFVEPLGLSKLSISDPAQQPKPEGQEEDSSRGLHLLKGGKDDKLGVHFDEPELKHLTLALLSFNCPDPICTNICSGWKDLKLHAKRAHDRSLCEYCTRNMKIFTHEHMLYTPAQLRVHIERGDVNLNTPVQKGFTGHPQCEFCRIRYYDNEQLFRHMRDAHEQCFICVRNGSGRDQYFVNYSQLEQHFESDHHCCSARVCRESKFVVFETAMDLQQHEMEVHGEALSHTTKRAQKEARRLQVDITYGDSSSNTGGSGQSGSNAAAAAEQRQRQQEAEARARAREFFAARDGPSTSGLDSPSTSGPRTVPGLPSGPVRGSRAGFSGQLTSDGQGQGQESAARRAQKEAEQKARHAAVMERVSHTLGGSELKVSAFKTAVRTFRGGECSAEDLLSTLWSLFDRRLDALENVVFELADLLDLPDKSQTLLTAWENFHVADSFPALAGGSGPSTMAMPAARPRKAAVTSRGNRSNDIWSRVQQAAGSSTPGSRNVVGLPPVNHYPSLPSSSAPSRGTRNTPWSGSTASARPAPTPTPSSGSSTPHSVSYSGTPQRKPANGKAPARASAMDFPSLPASATAAAKNAQMRDIFNRPAASPSGWGAVPSTSSTPPLSDAEPADVGGGGGKKGKKGKKQLLFTVGGAGP